MEGSRILQVMIVIVVETPRSGSLAGTQQFTVGIPVFAPHSGVQRQAAVGSKRENGAASVSTQLLEPPESALTRDFSPW